MLQLGVRADVRVEDGGVIHVEQNVVNDGLITFGRDRYLAGSPWSYAETRLEADRVINRGTITNQVDNTGHGLGVVNVTTNVTNTQTLTITIAVDGLDPNRANAVQDGQLVRISGVHGNYGANGVFRVTNKAFDAGTNTITFVPMMPDGRTVPASGPFDAQLSQGSAGWKPYQDANVMRVVGDFEQTASGMLHIQGLLGESSYFGGIDHKYLEVHGDVTLGGALVVSLSGDLNDLDNHDANNYYTILRTTGDITGAFDSIDVESLESQQFRLLKATVGEWTELRLVAVYNYNAPEGGGGFDPGPGDFPPGGYEEHYREEFEGATYSVTAAIPQNDLNGIPRLNVSYRVTAQGNPNSPITVPLSIIAFARDDFTNGDESKGVRRGVILKEFDLDGPSIVVLNQENDYTSEGIIVVDQLDLTTMDDTGVDDFSSDYYLEFAFGAPPRQIDPLAPPPFGPEDPWSRIIRETSLQDEEGRRIFANGAFLAKDETATEVLHIHGDNSDNTISIIPSLQIGFLHVLQNYRDPTTMQLVDVDPLKEKKFPVGSTSRVRVFMHNDVDSFDVDCALRDDARVFRVHGGDGNDQIKTGAGNDVLFGGRGADIIEGRKAADTIFGGMDNDTLYGESLGTSMSAGSDTLIGGSGSDVLFGDFGLGVTSAGATDTLRGGFGEDDVYPGRAATDQIEFQNGYDGLVDKVFYQADSNNTHALRAIASQYAGSPAASRLK